MEVVHLLDTEHIIYCEFVDNYTRFHLKDKQLFLVFKSIKAYEELLYDQSFLRVHKSYLVNISHIHKYENEALLKMSYGHSEAVSRRKKHALKKLRFP